MKLHANHHQADEAGKGEREEHRRNVFAINDRAPANVPEITNEY